MLFPQSDLIGRWFGNYRVVQIIKAGGLAGQLCAYDGFANRYVAIAVSGLRPDMDDDFVSRFEHVAQVLRDLEHPNILGVYDWGQDHDDFYCVMELTTADSLVEHLRHGPLPAPETGRILRKLASALSAVHSRQIFHRDLKPSKVLLDRDREQVWLTDFCPTPAGNTMSGTFSYMAPELLKGQAINVRTEVYSLGLLVFKMLTGRLPFDESSSESFFAFHKNQKQAPALNALRTDVPKRMAIAVNKAISGDPGARYANVEDFADEAWPVHSPEKPKAV
jgi:serine/threonine protein kinase